MQSFMERLQAAARAVAGSPRTVALTGAGISVGSGIPPFRGPGGLWTRYDPEEYAHIDSFRLNPARSWVMLKEMMRVIGAARPNPAHYALAELERMGRLQVIITQNVDGLHQEAGSRDVIEYHGNSRGLVCLDCGRKFGGQEVSLDVIPPLCACGGLLKPGAVFFGELIPAAALRRAQEEAESCRVMLVVGTSAMVEPAAGLPYVARRAGATVIEVNPEGAFVSDISLDGRAEDVLPSLVEEVKRLTAAP